MEGKVNKGDKVRCPNSGLTGTIVSAEGQAIRVRYNDALGWSHNVWTNEEDGYWVPAEEEKLAKSHVRVIVKRDAGDDLSAVVEVDRVSREHFMQALVVAKDLICKQLEAELRKEPPDPLTFWVIGNRKAFVGPEMPSGEIRLYETISGNPGTWTYTVREFWDQVQRGHVRRYESA